METPQRAEGLTLIRAELDAQGLHTATMLSRQVRRGTYVRIRRGVYAAREAWSTAHPWDRYAATVTAVALSGVAPVFCRESALVLHGLPLLHTPMHVHLRTLHRSQVGPRGGSGYGSGSGSGSGGFSSRFHEPPLPSGVTRNEVRGASDRGRALLSTTRIDPAPLLRFGVSLGPVTAEPLELTLVDTVPRLPFADAVVVLDAALARTTRMGDDLETALAPWTGFIRGSHQLASWSRALSFADRRSESVGESFSRVRIAELGFQAPVLQTTLWVEGRQYRLDFEWEGSGVVGEFDGRNKYLQAQTLFGASAGDVVYREKLREDAIRSTGRRVVRWGWEELRHPQVLRERLERAGVPRM